MCKELVVWHKDNSMNRKILRDIARCNFERDDLFRKKIISLLLGNSREVVIPVVVFI